MFAVPDTVPFRSVPSHSETVMPCVVAMPLAENLPSVISGANGSARLAAVISVSKPWPLRENFATAHRGTHRRGAQRAVAVISGLELEPLRQSERSGELEALRHHPAHIEVSRLDAGEEHGPRPPGRLRPVDLDAAE